MAVTTYAYVILCLWIPITLAGVAYPRPEPEVTATRLLGSPQLPSRTGRMLDSQDFPTDLAAPPMDAYMGPKGVFSAPAVPKVNSWRFKSITAIPATNSNEKQSSRPWRTVPVKTPRIRTVSGVKKPVQSFVEVVNDLVIEDSAPVPVSSKNGAQVAKSVYKDDNDLLR